MIQVEKVGPAQWTITVWTMETYALIGSSLEQVLVDLEDSPPIPTVDNVMIPGLRQITSAMKANK